MKTLDEQITYLEEQLETLEVLQLKSTPLQESWREECEMFKDILESLNKLKNLQNVPISKGFYEEFLKQRIDEES